MEGRMGRNLRVGGALKVKNQEVLDGLYPNGPVMDCCIENNRQFMIVLKDGSLSSVWEEYNVLKELEENNSINMKWGNRRQKFQWVNRIEYWVSSGVSVYKARIPG